MNTPEPAVEPSTVRHRPLQSGLLLVAAAMMERIDPQAIIHSFIPTLASACGELDAGLFWIYERRSARLRLVDSFGLGLDLNDYPAPMHSISDGLAHQAIHTGKLIYLHTQKGYRDLFEAKHAQLSPLFDVIPDRLPSTISVAVVPLIIGSERFGVLELFFLKDSPKVLAAEYHAVLDSFSMLIASALRHANLAVESNQHRRRISAFDAVVTVITGATDLQSLLRGVLDVVLGLGSFTSGMILLLDPVRDELSLGSQRHLPNEYVYRLSNIPIAGSFCEEVVRYGQPVQRPLLDNSIEQVLIETGVSTCIYLPLLAGGTVVGVMGIYDVGHLMHQVDTATLMPISNQIGFAIANVRLYEDSKLERRKLSTVLSSIAEGVVLCNAQGEIVLVNEAALNMLNLDTIPYHQQLSEMTDFYGLRSLDDRPLPIEDLPLARALSGEIFHDYRVLIRGANERDSVMSFSGSPAYGEDNSIEGAVVIFRDVTERQKIERAKDEFLTVAAHELRSPLAAVRSYAEFLLRREKQRGETDPRDLHGLTLLSQQVAHMLRMVDNLLDVSHIDTGQLSLEMKPVNLVELAQQAINQQRPIVQNRELILNGQQAILVVHCDELRIAQVLTNFLGNAVKYGAPDTPISVRIALNQRSDTISSHDALPEVMVSVHNQGEAIPLDLQERLFNKFTRGRGLSADGLGLGLYLSREIIHLHGGRIWVESSESQGTTFCFSLPLALTVR